MLLSVFWWFLEMSLTQGLSWWQLKKKRKSYWCCRRKQNLPITLPLTCLPYTCISIRPIYESVCTESIYKFIFKSLVESMFKIKTQFRYSRFCSFSFEFNLPLVKMHWHFGRPVKFEGILKWQLQTFCNLPEILIA